MKTLVVYNNNGQLIFTQTNAIDSYNLIVEDVADNKEIIGVDLLTGKSVTVKTDLSDYKKQQKLDELEEKNRVYLLEHDLEKVQAENEELNGEIKESIRRLESANAEIGEILFSDEE